MSTTDPLLTIEEKDDKFNLTRFKLLWFPSRLSTQSIRSVPIVIEKELTGGSNFKCFRVLIDPVDWISAEGCGISKQFRIVLKHSNDPSCKHLSDNITIMKASGILPCSANSIYVIGKARDGFKSDPVITHDLNTSTLKPYALKIGTSKNAHQDCIKTLQLFRKLTSHHNVIQPIMVWSHKHKTNSGMKHQRTFAQIAPLADGDLFDFLNARKQQASTAHFTSLPEGAAPSWPYGCCPPLPSHTRFLLNTARDLASGLLAIHMAGFVHLDMKPENALVFHNDSNNTSANVQSLSQPHSRDVKSDGPWIVKLCDFGSILQISPETGVLACSSSPLMNLMELSRVMYTPEYVAPELLPVIQSPACLSDDFFQTCEPPWTKYNIRTLDIRKCDVYSLGVMVHQMLFGDVPHPIRGISPKAYLHAYRHRIATAEFDDPSSIAECIGGVFSSTFSDTLSSFLEGAPPSVHGVVQLCRSMLHPDPQQRPSTVDCVMQLELFSIQHEKLGLF